MLHNVTIWCTILTSARRNTVIRIYLGLQVINTWKEKDQERPPFNTPLPFYYFQLFMYKTLEDTKSRFPKSHPAHRINIYNIHFDQIELRWKWPFPQLFCVIPVFWLWRGRPTGVSFALSFSYVAWSPEQHRAARTPHQQRRRNTSVCQLLTGWQKVRQKQELPLPIRVLEIILRPIDDPLLITLTPDLFWMRSDTCIGSCTKAFRVTPSPAMKATNQKCSQMVLICAS